MQTISASLQADRWTRFESEALDDLASAAIGAPLRYGSHVCVDVELPKGHPRRSIIGLIGDDTGAGCTRVSPALEARQRPGYAVCRRRRRRVARLDRKQCRLERRHGEWVDRR